MDDRFTIRWDVSMGCYRVSTPNLSGPVEVVRARLHDQLQEALDELAHAAREFSTAAEYSVEESVEMAFVEALERAEGLLHARV